ncbi:MAG: hypothetical protein DME26_04450 [Verrucomicrobia bacterium]|nr:MAG: hypothetical protein DME26_04450 [Verrucomicrobiota bacterium]
MKPIIQAAAPLFLFAVGVCAQPVSDFHLSNVNMYSPRPNATVSPRDYLFQVSGYYFGAAS